MKVSIETDERSAFLGQGQADVLVVLHPERQMSEQVDPAALRAHVNDVDPYWPLPAQLRRGQMDHLARRHRAWGRGRDEPSVRPFLESLGCRKDAPDRIWPCRADRRGAHVDDHGSELTCLWPSLRSRLAPRPVAPPGRGTGCTTRNSGPGGGTGGSSRG